VNRGSRNVLVVLLEDGRSPELRRALAPVDDANVHVVAPASVGKLQWLASDEDDARRSAERRAEHAGRAISDQGSVEVAQGDVDPVLAVEDELRRFPADEILIVGTKDEANLARSLERLGLPVRRAREARPPEDADGLTRTARDVAEGRSEASPFALLAGVNLVVFALVGVVIAVVALAFWLAAA